MNDKLLDTVAKLFTVGAFATILYIQEYRSEQHSKLLKKHDAEILRLSKSYKDLKNNQKYY